MIHGIINIYKEKGYTSHDVVAKMRGILKQKKIGHTGTLDPDAEGVLPVCLGSGTKLCDMLTDKDKTYRTVMLLGKETDTQDITGSILREKEVTVTKEEAEKAILSFVGDYEQIPPMYSALKVNGKKLYELAREGKTVERKPRSVVIYDIEIESIELPRVTMTVNCSKGTYIRTLCHDIGQKLGCGACMEELTRTKVGQFYLKDSIRLSELEELKQDPESSRLMQYVMPVDHAFENYRKCLVKPEFDKLLYNGNPLLCLQFSGVEQDVPSAGECIKVYDSVGHFCGIYEYDDLKRRFKPVKMFLPVEK